MPLIAMFLAAAGWVENLVPASAQEPDERHRHCTVQQIADEYIQDFIDGYSRETCRFHTREQCVQALLLLYERLVPTRFEVPPDARWDPDEVVCELASLKHRGLESEMEQFLRDPETRGNVGSGAVWYLVAANTDVGFAALERIAETTDDVDLLKSIVGQFPTANHPLDRWISLTERILQRRVGDDYDCRNLHLLTQRNLDTLREEQRAYNDAKRESSPSPDKNDGGKVQDAPTQGERSVEPPEGKPGEPSAAAAGSSEGPSQGRSLVWLAILAAAGVVVALVLRRLRSTPDPGR